ncbi:hypothetical protein [Spiroplasma endosymbiont of Asaphidion curtum]|uniref:hypothetical protein n=1 Tax=Spiroplasma endosymbiont of Asaphidion curtum TaxID=3066281 RepID=UPI00313B71AF
MKKLLGLLSTITIASSGAAGIVANSPMPIKKGKTIQNNDKLNFSETINLGNLTRNKRETNSFDDYLEFNNKYAKL